MVNASDSGSRGWGFEGFYMLLAVNMHDIVSTSCTRYTHGNNKAKIIQFHKN